MKFNFKTPMNYEQIKKHLLGNAHKVLGCTSGCFVLAVGLFALLFGWPLISFFQSSNFEFSTSWFQQNPAGSIAIIFAGIFALLIAGTIAALAIQWTQTHKRISQYVDSAEALGIAIDPTKVVFEKDVPFHAGKVAMSSSTGLGTVTFSGQPFQIYHNYELRNSVRMVKGGILAWDNGNTVTAIETTVAKKDLGFTVVNKDLLKRSYNSNKLVYSLVDLESPYALMVYQEGTVDASAVQKSVKALLGDDYLEKFKQLPGENSLMYHHGILYLFHEGFISEQEQLKDCMNFLKKFT